MNDFRNRDFQENWDMWRYLKREIFVVPFKFRHKYDKAKDTFLEWRQKLYVLMSWRRPLPAGSNRVCDVALGHET
jgi:hypothetical protein